MIKPKQGICIDCPPGSQLKYLTAGRCQSHYWQHRRIISVKKTEQRNPNLKSDKEELGKWFEFHNKNNLWICENCGIHLHPYSPKAASSCQAHILPKSKFKSVQSVLENHMTLGDPVFQSCPCHDDYDHSWDKAQRMPVWKLAVERFLSFKHLIHPSEYKFLPDPL